MEGKFDEHKLKISHHANDHKNKVVRWPFCPALSSLRAVLLTVKKCIHLLLALCLTIFKCRACTLAIGAGCRRPSQQEWKDTAVRAFSVLYILLKAFTLWETESLFYNAPGCRWYTCPETDLMLPKREKLLHMHSTLGIGA
jgi:hypothetical protein